MANFFRRGVSKIYWVTTIAATTKIPTAAEVLAGVDLTPKVHAIDGLVYENQPIDAENMAEAFTPTIPGPDTVARTTVTFLEDKTSNPIRTTLTKGTSGYLVFFFAGIAGAAPAAADKADVWPSIVTGRPRDPSIQNNPALYRIGFTPSATPAEDIAVAA
jgi:hypothetical protein